MFSLKNLDLRGKRVLIRVDLNVPMDPQGTITDDTRIRATLPTIQYVLDHGGKVILMSHLGRPKGKSSEFSLAPCAKRLSELLKKPVVMAPDCIGEEVEALVAQMKPGDVLLLENLRFYPAEEKPDLDPSFAKKLASLADVYINDAFGAAHRPHASITTLTQYFPGKKAAGALLEKEIAFLGDALKSPKRPFYAIIGGAKVSTKIGILRTLLEKCDALFVGGAMAYTFMKAQGKAIGTSFYEEAMVEEAQHILQKCHENNIAFYLPVDVVVTTKCEENAPFTTVDSATGIPDGYMGVDIGEKTASLWAKSIKDAKTVLWNGPLGVYEIESFAKGTTAIVKAIGQLKNATTIAGGGETIHAIRKCGLTDAFTHISTGGGASLEFIETGTLPGIEALN